jgi:hypothetical protein
MVAWALTGVLAASPAPVALEWSRGSGAERCPDAPEVRAAVATHLGYEPFREGAETTITVQVSAAESGLHATIEVNRPGAALRRRELSSGTIDCSELAAAIELAIAIAIDPRSLAAAEPRRVAAPSPPPAAAPPPAAPSVSELHAGVFAGAHAALGTSPSVAPGFVIGARLQLPRFEAGLEGRADLSSKVSVSAGRVNTTALLGSAVPCLRPWKLGVCAILSGGAMQVTGELGAGPVRATSPLVLIGARVVLELLLSDVLGVEPWLEVQAVLTRISLRSEQMDLWVTPPVAGAMGVRLWLRFF